MEFVVHGICITSVGLGKMHINTFSIWFENPAFSRSSGKCAMPSGATSSSIEAWKKSSKREKF